MRCAWKRCRGTCTSKNWLGVGDVCSAPSSFDPTRTRIDTHWDRDLEDADARDQIHQMREIDQ